MSFIKLLVLDADTRVLQQWGKCAPVLMTDLIYRPGKSFVALLSSLLTTVCGFEPQTLIYGSDRSLRAFIILQLM